MRSLGWALIQSDWFFKRRADLDPERHQEHAHMGARSCEGTARRRRLASQADRPPNQPCQHSILDFQPPFVRRFCCLSHPVCGTFGEGNGNPLQYSYLENPMDGGVWQATVHGVTKSRTRLHFQFLPKYSSKTILVLTNISHKCPRRRQIGKTGM